MESEISSAIMMSALLLFISTFDSGITGALSAMTIKIDINKKRIFLALSDKKFPLTRSFARTSGEKQSAFDSFWVSKNAKSIKSGGNIRYKNSGCKNVIILLLFYFSSRHRAVAI